MARSRILSRFLHDERGIAMVFVAIMIPVLVGFALLAIDMSRVNNLHNDLQSGVDAIALAAAAELDGNSHAIDRAKLAVANLVDNSTKFSNAGAGDHQLTADDVTVTYLTAIPASDATALSDDGTDAANGKNYATTDSASAIYAEVTVKTGRDTSLFSTIFPASFLGGSNDFAVRPQAVAGFTGIVTCDMTPVFICDPFKNPDGTGPGFNEAVSSSTWFGRSVTLETKGTSWGPGNFGFLRPSNNQGYGDNDLRVDLARGTVQECVTSRHLYTSTGNLTADDIAGFNTRFDMFPANGNSFPSKTDTRWPAAPNVRKGYMPNPKGQSSACNVVPGTDASKYMGLPPDNSSDPTITGGLVGNGTWNYSQYIATNNLGAVKAHFDGDGINQPTRYQVYSYEYASGAYTTPSAGGEVGNPQCTTTNTTTDLERRLIYGAIVDCSNQDNLDALNGASGKTLKAEGFGSFFMLSPVVDSVQTEAVDVSGKLGQGTMTNFARDDVQLYR